MFIAELTAWLYTFFTHRWNHWIFNIIFIIQVLISIHLYYPFVKNKLERFVLKYSVIFFISLYFLNIIIAKKFERFDTTTFDLGALFVIYFSLSYLKNLVFSDNIIPLGKTSFFWISTGNLIYWAGSLFYLGLINYIVDKRLDPSGSLLNFLVYTFSAIQYCLFITAMLCNLKSDQI